MRKCLAESREIPCTKKGNFDAFFREKCLTKNKSKEETQVHGALKAAYYDAFRAARQEINAGAVEAQGGFDARA